MAGYEPEASPPRAHKAIRVIINESVCAPVKRKRWRTTLLGEHMNKPWFRPLGWIYRPNSWAGVLVTALTFAFCLNVFNVVDRHSHSVSDTLYGIFPYVAPALMILNWIASKTCGSNNA
jgi:hypothetical protein